MQQPCDTVYVCYEESFCGTTKTYTFVNSSFEAVEFWINCSQHLQPDRLYGFDIVQRVRCQDQPENHLILRREGQRKAIVSVYDTKEHAETDSSALRNYTEKAKQNPAFYRALVRLRQLSDTFRGRK